MSSGWSVSDAETDRLHAGRWSGILQALGRPSTRRHPKSSALRARHRRGRVPADAGGRPRRACRPWRCGQRERARRLSQAIPGEDLPYRHVEIGELRLDNACRFGSVPVDVLDVGASLAEEGRRQQGEHLGIRKARLDITAADAFWPTNTLRRKTLILLACGSANDAAILRRIAWTFLRSKGDWIFSAIVRERSRSIASAALRCTRPDDQAVVTRRPPPRPRSASIGTPRSRRISRSRRSVRMLTRSSSASSAPVEKSRDFSSPRSSSRRPSRDVVGFIR